MKTQEPDSVFDQLIDDAIADELKQEPDSFLVQKVMSNIHSISQENEVFTSATLKPSFSFRFAVVYGLSIAASIFIGYYIGCLNVTPPDLNVLQINFENMNMNSVIAF